MTAQRWLALLGLLSASCTGGGSAENHCRRDSECTDGASCDHALGACVSEKTTKPYDLVLQVSQLSNVGLARYTLPRFTLTGSGVHDLAIPEGVTVVGRVADARNPDQLDPISAEVSFRPLTDQTGFAVLPVIVESGSQGKDELATNLQAVLAPGRMYEVAVQPLGQDSSRYPPTTAHFELDGADSRFELDYTALDSLTATLVDEAGTPQAGRWVRILSNETRAVVSSLAIADAEGKLVLWALPGALLDPTLYTIEVNLNPRNPWGETIRVDPATLDPVTSTLTIPTVPAKVSFKGSVESGELKAAPLADMTFVSQFPLPSLQGDVRGRDWCRSHAASAPSLPPYTCSAVVNTSTDASGRFSVALLPGDYDVFVVPNRENGTQRATTLHSIAVIETQPSGGPQQGQAFSLPRASVYRGSVVGLDGDPVVNAAVRVIALGLQGTRGPVAAYNRSSDAVTRSDGSFELAVDTGYFDVVTQPPDESGYPWIYVANREIVPKDMSVIELSRFTLPLPVLVRGTLEAGGARQVGARVDAYAVVKNIVGGSRGVLVGTATTDEDGKYVLKLPPEVADGTEESD